MRIFRRDLVPLEPDALRADALHALPEHDGAEFGLDYPFILIQPHICDAFGHGEVLAAPCGGELRGSAHKQYAAGHGELIAPILQLVAREGQAAVYRIVCDKIEAFAEHDGFQRAAPVKAPFPEVGGGVRLRAHGEKFVAGVECVALYGRFAGKDRRGKLRLVAGIRVDDAVAEYDLFGAVPVERVPQHVPRPQRERSPGGIGGRHEVIIAVSVQDAVLGGKTVAARLRFDALERGEIARKSEMEFRKLQRAAQPQALDAVHPFAEPDDIRALRHPIFIGGEVVGV